MIFYRGPQDEFPMTSLPDFKPGDVITIIMDEHEYRMIVSEVDHDGNVVNLSGWPDPDNELQTPT